MVGVGFVAWVGVAVGVSPDDAVAVGVEASALGVPGFTTGVAFGSVLVLGAIVLHADKDRMSSKPIENRKRCENGLADLLR